MDKIPKALIPAVDEQKQVENLSINTTPTGRHVAVDNPELIGELRIGAIPIINPAVLIEKELAIESMGAIPTSLISGVSHPQRPEKLRTNAIPFRSEERRVGKEW